MLKVSPHSSHSLSDGCTHAGQGCGGHLACLREGFLGLPIPVEWASKTGGRGTKRGKQKQGQIRFTEKEENERKKRGHNRESKFVSANDS